MSPKTQLFAVAIENYADTFFEPVVYAEHNVLKFVEAWQEVGVEADDCVLLMGGQATQGAIRSSLSECLRKLGAEDRLILFYTGHGAAIHDSSVITAFDTQISDVANTSIQLGAILKEIREAKVSQVLLFLDVSHRRIPIDLGAMPSSLNEFNGDELRSFCRESALRFAFASCEASEVSYRSGDLGMGIWTHCLVQGIQGSAKNAVRKDGCVSTGSLQSHVLAEVPRILRVTVAGTVSQTPVMWGSKSKELVIVDLAALLQQRQLTAVGTTNPIKDACLTGETRGRVRDLRGYTKPKASLSTHNDWEREFVEKAGAGEVTLHATKLFEQLRESFRYKRKDLSFTNIASTASIKGPDFDVNISLSQDPDDAEKYRLTTEVRSFRNATVIADPNFLSIFNRYCTRVVFELDTSLDLESKIDDIEEIESLAEHLEYDPECTEFTLRLPASRIIIYATVDRIVFSLDAHGDLKQLLSSTEKAFAQLAGNSIQLGLRRS